MYLVPFSSLEITYESVSPYSEFFACSNIKLQAKPSSLVDQISISLKSSLSLKTVIHYQLKWTYLKEREREREKSSRAEIPTLLFINALRHCISLCWFFLSILSCLKINNNNINGRSYINHSCCFPLLLLIQSILTVSYQGVFQGHPGEAQVLHVQNC